MTIDDILDAATIIPVLEVADLKNAAPLAAALAGGGLRVVELTLRTECAFDAIKAMQDAAPELIVGMGTIRSSGDIEKCVAAGADFLVSPGASHSLLKALAGSGVPALPGVATASEAMAAFERGFRHLKFFPAEPAGGVSYLKSLIGPLPDLAFCPTGGIGEKNAPAYLALSNVACVGGSWIAPKDIVAAEDWAMIEDNARKASALESQSH